MDTKSEAKATKILVIGGTGAVGSYVVEQLVRRGERPFVLSREPHHTPDVEWIRGDMEQPATLDLPPVTTLYCTADAVLLADILSKVITPSLQRIVAFSSTSVMTKLDTEVAAEREILRNLAEAEQRIIATCEQHRIGWTILRPTLIYKEGHDINITPLSRLIRRFRFMPLVGGGTGLRQPVHAEDLAIGAIAAAGSPAASNKIYCLPGGETLSYREMIGRIFDGLRLPRRMISIPAALWRMAFALAHPLFPDANVAMGLRMTKDMTFDATPAIEDFGWNPRSFHPVFD